MSRWSYFWLCAILGLLLAVCGFLVPAHLKAVDSGVVQRAGKRSQTLLSEGLSLAGEKKLGAAEMLGRAAKQESLPGSDTLETALDSVAVLHPDWRVWGGGERHLELLFTQHTTTARTNAEPLTEFVIRLGNRERVLELLQASSNPEIQELLRCRNLSKTALFPPSSSSSGQAFDAAISVCGLLMDEKQLTTNLSARIYVLAKEANRSGNSQPLEEVLMDLLSLGQRFNWGQLAVFVSQIPDPETLRLLSGFSRKAEAHLPMLFSVVELSGNPVGTAKYLMNFSQSGYKDLGMAIHFGAGAINELLSRQVAMYISPYRGSLAQIGPLAGFSQTVLDLSWRRPRIALGIKWLCYLLGGFLLGAAFHYSLRPAKPLERPLQVRGFHFAREFLFSLGFLLVVLLLSEPFLAQDSQKVEMPFRLRLPTVGSAITARGPAVKSSFMNQLSLMTLLLFFVLQALIYTACVLKLAEIRRQNLVPRIKLRLLDNEEHLFDAGLYLGFVGTIISLILVSLGVIKPSLMAAYSSTSFGIIFVSFFKIFHLRPLKRTLLLESEVNSPDPVTTGLSRPVVTPS